MRAMTRAPEDAGAEGAVDISHVVTTYRSGPEIAHTIASLTGQETSLRREFIFVDDASPDGAADRVERALAGVPSARVIRNAENRGPSVRLNQGAAAARGRWLHFLDHDDLMPVNALAAMVGAAERREADLLYGRWERTGAPAAESLSRRIAEGAATRTCDAPLAEVLKGGFTRMRLIVRRETFHAAGGADPRIFIQDESLPIRLAAAARRLVLLDAPTVLVPAGAAALSADKRQQNHDRFLANHLFLQDHPELAAPVRRALARRALSAGWKEARRARGVAAYASGVFAAYAAERVLGVAPPPALLDALAARFAALDGVRRPQ